ncbi:FTR1 family iron permease [Pseudochelatococcus contaminans]|uniref:High-affinity iron transporter n=1 Tax=Pseudochelatococcus contaminans TaxID=1538103 RepID=A0A7W5Z5K2_9HYPH|nr:FTR1 family protein [Pseudochelatococcus contaminans]MBB3810523.1 high-affinity iron transporter [Pseudochelatococcus contaminans]
MLAALIIVFREVLEAGLIVGVVLAASRGIRHRGLYVAGGVLAGVLGAAIIAVFADQISNLFDGTGQEILNAIVLAVAVVMLVWTGLWMSTHGRQLTEEIKTVGKDVVEGRKPLTALAIVVAAAVLREGFEVVLFLYGVVAAGGTTAASIAIGGFLGILAGAAVSALLYLGIVAIPLKHVFSAISVLITLLAAGLAAQSIGLLQSAGYFEVWADPLWDTSNILTEDSIVGRVLHSLVGYTAQPSGLQLVAYIGVIVITVVLTRAIRRPVSHKS